MKLPDLSRLSIGEQAILVVIFAIVSCWLVWLALDIRGVRACARECTATKVFSEGTCVRMCR